jgi:hypothetical protein
LTVNNVVSTGTSFVTCTPSLGDTSLLSIQWSP